MNNLNNLNNFKLLVITFFTGFIGDLLLQIATSKGLIDDFLKSYFKQHGVFESACIGGGMMTLFYILFIYSGLEFNYKNLIIYGIILDLLFRELNIFPSLKEYYIYLNYFWSAVWGAIPIILPYFIFNLK